LPNEVAIDSARGLASLPDPDLVRAVRSGLARVPKTLPCRFFYDLEGSRLFDRICELPEYYLTRTEDQILRDHASEMVAMLPPGLEIAELGSGSASKTRRILEAALQRQPTLRYVPIDISAEMLAHTASDLSCRYAGLRVDPLAGEYSEALPRLRHSGDAPMLLLFLGSNLGNFTPEEAVPFLAGLRRVMRPGDRLLMGLDLRKDPRLLEAAYDDVAGVTAEFNLNLLRRINRELGADFDLASFTHRAVYNREEGRVEMYLVSERAQTVTVAGQSYPFAAGEALHTENSYKYTLPQICDLSARAGLDLARTWTDPQQWFSVNLFAPATETGGVR
jgi:L-histidine Nalpha-methyltransferase